MTEYEMIRDVIQKYCSQRPIIFELGCFDGSLTRAYYGHSLQKPLHYFAFEADPDNFKKMQANNTIPPEVALINKAIADYTGTCEFYKSSGDLNGNQYTVSGSIREPKEHLKFFPHVKFDKMNNRINCVCLDDFCKENNIQEIDIILADIQGAEKNMIQGGKTIIPKTKFMFIEKCDDELYKGMLITNELKEFLKDTFDVCAEWENDILFYNKSIKL